MNGLEAKARIQVQTAGATTLIVSLGIVTKPFYLLILKIAVALLVGQGILINRLAGPDYPYMGETHRITESSPLAGGKVISSIPFMSTRAGWRQSSTNWGSADL